MLLREVMKLKSMSSEVVRLSLGNAQYFSLSDANSLAEEEL
jgi:hypothetical protein